MRLLCATFLHPTLSLGTHSPAATVHIHVTEHSQRPAVRKMDGVPARQGGPLCQQVFAAPGSCAVGKWVGLACIWGTLRGQTTKGEDPVMWARFCCIDVLIAGSRRGQLGSHLPLPHRGSFSPGQRQECYCLPWSFPITYRLYIRLAIHGAVPSS